MGRGCVTYTKGCEWFSFGRTLDPIDRSCATTGRWWWWREFLQSGKLRHWHLYWRLSQFSDWTRRQITLSPTLPPVHITHSVAIPTSLIFLPHVEVPWYLCFMFSGWESPSPPVCSSSCCSPPSVQPVQNPVDFQRSAQSPAEGEGRNLAINCHNPQIFSLVQSKKREKRNKENAGTPPSEKVSTL